MILYIYALASIFKIIHNHKFAVNIENVTFTGSS